jgi:hypothetical protein
MSSTSLAPSTPKTASSALTTPFVQLKECKTIYDLISTTVQTGGYSSSAAILVSDAAASSFSSCQPSGWDQETSSRFHFSPAVCPSEWTYYSMGPITISSATVSPSVITTAYCCARFAPSPLPAFHKSNQFHCLLAAMNYGQEAGSSP